MRLLIIRLLPAQMETALELSVKDGTKQLCILADNSGKSVLAQRSQQARILSSGIGDVCLPGGQAAACEHCPLP